MTKTFNKDSIIPMDGGYVVVDKELPLEKDDKFVIDAYNSHQYGIKTALVIGYDIIRCKEGWPRTLPIDKSECLKVVASIGKKIEGIPLIELVDTATRIANMAIHGSFPDATEEERKLYREIYANGYRTAQQGKYTKEEVHEAIGIGMRSKDGDTLESRITYFHEWKKRKDEYELLQVKRPITIELEYWGEWGKGTEYENPASLRVDGPTIKPIKVVYE